MGLTAILRLTRMLNALLQTKVIYHNILDTECKETPIYIQVYLLDVNGDLRDSLDYRVQITRKSG